MSKENLFRMRHFIWGKVLHFLIYDSIVLNFCIRVKCLAVEAVLILSNLVKKSVLFFYFHLEFIGLPLARPKKNPICS